MIQTKKYSKKRTNDIFSTGLFVIKMNCINFNKGVVLYKRQKLYTIFKGLN